MVETMVRRGGTGRDHVSAYVPGREVPRQRLDVGQDCRLYAAISSLAPVAYNEMLFWNSEARFPERFTNESVCVEIDLPVVVVVAVWPNC